MTLGLYIPPTDITDAESKGSSVSSEADLTNITEVVEDKDTYEELTSFDTASFLTEKAKEQAMKKLGPRILNQLEDELESIILPKIEEELEMIFARAEEDHIAYYEITENPATGYGERIFNVYDHHAEETIAKFHVRRDYRPLEGYWFNFHYHLKSDGFEIHHEIGNVYWDKNMPPKWMA